jgi:hypothetical protein
VLQHPAPSRDTRIWRLAVVPGEACLTPANGIACRSLICQINRHTG